MAESEPSASEPLAVFDVDGTLFRRGLLPALTRRLVGEGVFSERVREERRDSGVARAASFVYRKAACALTRWRNLVFGEAVHAEPDGKRLSPGRIEEAARCIDPVFLDSPKYEAEALGDELGCRLVCKVETANPIRSFKGRGTDYLLHRLGGEEGRLVCASAGNFGQGLACAARKRNVPLTVFAAESANPAKVESMRRLGAEVRLGGEDFDESKAAARALAGSEGWRFVEDGREAEISESAGTIALELCRWPEPFDTLLVPLGNGALLSGVGTWMKAHAPSTQVVGVCAQGAPAMALSLREGVTRTTQKTDTIADGIAVRVPVEEALSDLSGVVDDVLLVDDEAMVEAIRLLFWKMGLVVEPAGAAGAAALLAHRERFAGALVATPLCGGNLTAHQARRWLLEDAPGSEEKPSDG